MRLVLRMVGLLGALAIGGAAFAHGGGLNAQGCHTHRKTGDFHCHRAPAAAPAPRPPAASLAPTRPQTEARTNAKSGDVYYRNCDAARADGAAPVYRGDPGYGSHLDRDDDGVGCE